MFGKLRVILCAVALVMSAPALASASLSLTDFVYFKNINPNYTFGTDDKKNAVLTKFDNYVATHSVSDIIGEFKALVAAVEPGTPYNGSQNTILIAANETFKILFKEAKNEVVLKWGNGPSNKVTFTAAVPGPIAGAGLPLLLGIAGYALYRSRKSEGEFAGAAA
jgi:hypothetical protein